MSQPVTPAARFDYRALSAAHRDVLVRVRDDIHRKLHRTAADLVWIGRQLIEAKKVVGHGAFGPWVEAEFPWSRAQAHRLMTAAAAFGDFSQIEKFDPSAVYLLSQPNTPPQARDFALQEVADGKRVTLPYAKEIVACHRASPPPPATRGELNELAPVRPEDVKGRADPDAGAAALWRAVADLLAGGGSLHLAAVEDGEGASVTATHYPADPGRPIRVEHRDTAADAVRAVAGLEPSRRCPHCKRQQPAGHFSRDGAKRVSWCKTCERARLKAWKARKKAKRLAGRPGEPDEGGEAPAQVEVPLAG